MGICIMHGAGGSKFEIFDGVKPKPKSDGSATLDTVDTDRLPLPLDTIFCVYFPTKVL